MNILRDTRHPAEKYNYWVLQMFGFYLFIILCCCQGSLGPQISDKQRKLFLTQPSGCGWRTVQHWSPRSSLCLTNVHQVPCISLRVGTGWSQSSTLCCISLWRQAHKGSQKKTIPLQKISCVNFFFSIYSSVRVQNFSQLPRNIFSTHVLDPRTFYWRKNEQL